MNNWFKQNGIHLAIIGIFFAISFVYFTPAFKGKALGQNDVTAAQSTQKEIMDYRAKDTTILWTNQILGGMPAFQIWAPYSGNITTHIVSTLKAIFPSPIDTVLLLLLGVYFLLCVLKLNPWLAAAGALAFAFSSYNIILMVAGHANQVFAIAFFAPIVTGIILALRGKYLLGASLTAFFLALEIRANHLQMTYYLLIAIILLVGFELYNAVKGKTLQSYVKAMIYLAVAGLLAIAVNASLLWSTYEYSKYTTRGPSNLTQDTKEPSNGLAKDYAFQYSQGIGECITFLIPNAYGGGSSNPVGEGSNVAKVLTDKGIDATQAENFAQRLPMYWGEKPFTAGPNYYGAVVFFLFVFGLIVVRNRIKWWLLSAVVLSVVLSFGSNLSFVSNLFFNYFPLYNKFRAVDSFLAIAMFCIPVLAFLAISEVINTTDKAPLFKKLLLALYITGGICLVFLAIPDMFFSFKASTTQTTLTDPLTQMFQGNGEMANSVVNALIQDRISIARADAFRSLVLVLIAFALVWAFIKQKINTTILSIAFLIVTLIDLWQVDKRYLKDDSFVDKQEALAPKPRDIDQIIMRDKDPDFRVFDVTQPIMTDSFTPYFHKSISGYSAARLKRYDEMVDNQLTRSVNQDVLDMLNVKYIITADQKSQNVTMHANPTACGHAWFVKSVKYAANPDKEMQAISSFDPSAEAIVEQRYSKMLDEKQTTLDTNGAISLVSYNPDHMIYQSGSITPQVAVFSEIYYEKGWKMLIDGVEKPYFRANYILRAAQIPTGNHKIEFIFHPASYYTGEKISMASSAIMILALLGALFMETRKKQTPAAPAPAKK